MTSLTHELVMVRWKGPLVSAFTCVAAAMLLAAAKVAFQSGFGASDLVPFFFWTIPLSVVIGLVKTGLVTVLRGRSAVITYATSGIIGAVAGLLWTYLVASSLGPYFGAFSFEVLTCWIVGGASGLIIAWNGAALSLPVSIAIVILIWFSGLLADRPIMRLLSGSRQIEVVAVKWKPGPDSLSNPPILGMKLSDADLERLKSIGLTGQVEFASSGGSGEGKRGRAIIVMSHQLRQSASLPQPDDCEVVYLQTREGWKMYPLNAATLGRNIQLWPDEREPERVTRYLIENADGTRQAGTLATW